MADLIKLDVQVSGFDEIAKVLKQLPEALQDKVIYSAARGTANVVAKDVRSLAGTLGQDIEGPPTAGADAAVIETYKKVPRKPRKAGGGSKKYGRLVDNVKVKKVRKRTGAVVTTGNAYWAMFYEFGSRHQPARPVFRRLWQANLPRYEEKYVAAMVKSLEATAKKLAGDYSKARKALGVR